MECLSHLIDPRFLYPLARTFSAGPQTEFDLRAKFMRDVPNRNLSHRVLRMLLDLAQRGGLIACEQGTWRAVSRHGLEQAVLDCWESWCAPDFSPDVLFRNRCAVCLDRGLLSAFSEFTSLSELACRPALTPAEWGRLISGSRELCQLTGWGSRHADADFLKLYRSARTAPITDDADVVPRIPRSLLPDLPTSSAGLLSSIRQARSAWWDQLNSFLGDVALADLSGFIVYAKELLDLLLWGTSFPLRSSVSPEHLDQISERFRHFGLRAEDLITVWRALPSVYRIISRLSWGVRYIANNLSHPEPAQPDAQAFLKVCALPLARQSSISASRSRTSLITLTRPLRVLHRALEGSHVRFKIGVAVHECAVAIAADMNEDKLLRRESAVRLRRLNVASSLDILDALAHPVVAPVFPSHADEVLASAGLIAAYSTFIESRPGKAYAEVRLALHAELDFQRRFNVHSLSAPERYDAVWQGTIQELMTRLEDTRKSCVPG